MNVVALVSGGKDSCYAMMRCITYGHQVVALANLLPPDDSVDELDSYMYQTELSHSIVLFPFGFGALDIQGQDGGKRMGLNFERVKYWLSVGAQPSEPVQRILFRAGVLPPPPMVAMGRKGGAPRPAHPLTGRILMPDKPATSDQPKDDEDSASTNEGEDTKDGEDGEDSASTS